MLRYLAIAPNQKLVGLEERRMVPHSFKETIDESELTVIINTLIYFPVNKLFLISFFFSGHNLLFLIYGPDKFSKSSLYDLILESSLQWLILVIPTISHAPRFKAQGSSQLSLFLCTTLGYQGWHRFFLITDFQPYDTNYIKFFCNFSRTTRTLSNRLGRHASWRF